jgi:hypothetical protein
MAALSVLCYQIREGLRRKIFQKLKALENRYAMSEAFCRPGSGRAKSSIFAFALPFLYQQLCFLITHKADLHQIEANGDAAGRSSSEPAFL